MTEEVKSCPFCGGKAEISEGAIYCPVCEISFSNERETGAEAIKEVEELWNVYFGKKATVESVAHESVHIANAVIDECKLYYNSKEDELLAYLVGYLTRELMECIR